MAWSGYIALGTLSGTTFVELTNSGYTRQPFAFSAPAGGVVHGVGGAISFPVVSDGNVWTHDAYAFFYAATGGSPVLVYPHATPGATVSPGTAHRVSPSRISVDFVDLQTASGGGLPVYQVSAITGIPAASRQSTKVGGIALDTSGTPGTIYSGYVLSGGDDFTGQLSVVNPQQSAADYFTTRAYVVPGRSNEGGRGGSILTGYDVDPYHTGYNDASHGVPLASIADMMVVGPGTSYTGTLTLKARVASGASETALVNHSQPTLSSMVHTGGLMLAQAPCIIEARMRCTPISTVSTQTAGNNWHPSVWVIASNPLSSWTGYEIDYETTAGGTEAAELYAWTQGVPANGANNDQDLVPGSMDGNWHTFTFVITSTAVNYYVDGAFVLSNPLSAAAMAGKPFYLLLTNHVVNAGTWSNLGASGAVMEVDWWRMWRQAGAAHRAPLVVQADINVAFSGSFSNTLPAAAAVWGDATVADNLEAVFNEYNAPGGNYSGGWSTASSTVGMFPPGVTYSGGVLSGSGFDKAGRIYFVRTGSKAGETVQPQRFAVNVGPKVTVSSQSWTQGNGVNLDLYPLCDVGDLLPKAITVSGLPAGLSFSAAGNTLGKITGTPSGSGSGSFSVTCTNSIGQSATASASYSIAAAAAPGAGTASPITSGLIASLDFDKSSSLTLSGSSITAIAGADGTSPAATQVTTAQAPTQVTIGTKYAGQFASASAQYLDWAALVTQSATAIGGGAHTVVVIARVVSNAASQSLIDMGQAAAGTTANRSSILALTNTQFAFRSGPATASDATGTAGDATGKNWCLIGVQPVSSATQFSENGSTTVAGPGTTGAIGTVDTISVGARKATGAYSLFANADIFRVLVFNRALNGTELSTIQAWAVTNYGTS